jgi:DNA-directed RNA polymerase subunit RPC12/RpoP
MTAGSFDTDNTNVLYRCPGCGEVSEDAPVGALYECMSDDCGATFSAGQGVEASGRKAGCPECNSTGKRIAGLGCDECGEGEVEKVTGIYCKECEEYVPEDDLEAHLTDYHMAEDD